MAEHLKIETLTEPNFEALYYEAAGRAVEYAQRNGELEAELASERRLHAEKCALLEEARTLADYRQGKLERRVGGSDRRDHEDPNISWWSGRRNAGLDRRQLIGSWRQS